MYSYPNQHVICNSFPDLRSYSNSINYTLNATDICSTIYIARN